jgi:signal transduction histidine kinase
MAGAPLPPDEAQRLAELRRYRILDTPSDASFDALTRLAARLCGTPDAYVSLVDRERQWFKASHGRLGRELSRESAFCAHAILGKDPLVVPDATLDPRFRENPLVTLEPNIRFYAGVPLRSSAGMPLGTLCVIDYAPRTLAAGQQEALQWLARQVELQLELWVRLLALEELLGRDGATAGLDAGERAHLELIALAAHDLKSPLSAVMANARFLLAGELTSQAHAAVLATLDSTQLALRQLADLMDVTLARRGRLEVRRSVVDAFALLEQVRRGATHLAQEGGLDLEVVADPAGVMVHTDGDLVRRILENLLDNALKYVPRGERIRLEVAGGNGGGAVFRVRDSGPGIPAPERQRVFEALTRLDGTPEHPRAAPSRGLGLHFCRIAAQALGGCITLEQDEPRGTLFVVHLPAG